MRTWEIWFKGMLIGEIDTDEDMTGSVLVKTLVTIHHYNHGITVREIIPVDEEHTITIKDSEVKKLMEYYPLNTPDLTGPIMKFVDQIHKIYHEIR